MQICWGRVPKARQLARFGQELSRDARLRLDWMSHYLTHGRNAAGRQVRVLALRRQFPRWGKVKLAVLLRERGQVVSTSLVGRILSRLKSRAGCSSSLVAAG